MERFWSKVNKTDTCWLWTAAKDQRGYGIVSIGGKLKRAHRVSYEMAKGPIPAGLVIDHIDCVTHCVRPEHLRAVTQRQNTENRKGANRGSKSGVLGVHWNKGSNKWQVIIQHKGKNLYLGLFQDLQEAAEAARVKRNELRTHNDKDRS